jgi:hypothetical protein
MTTEMELKSRKTGSLHFPSISVGSAIPGRLLLSRAYFHFTERVKLVKMTEKNNENQINHINNSNLIEGAIWPYRK